MPTFSPVSAALRIAGQATQGPPATETTELAPRSTVVFENEQQVRLSPNDNFTSDVSETAGNEGILAEVVLSPNSTQLQETVTRVRNRGVLPNALPAVSAAGAGDIVLDGEQLGNKSFTLWGGATAQVPMTYAALFIDPNNIILDNSEDGTITVDYDDSSGVNHIDSWSFAVDGLGPHYTSFEVATVNHVDGTGFSTSGPGTPTSSEQLLFGPACGDLAHEVLAVSGGEDRVPANDANNGGFADGDGFYIQATQTTDQRVYCGLPDVTDLNILNVISVQFEFYFKNLAGSGTGIEGLYRDGGGGSDQTVVSAFTTAGTESGAYTLQTSSALTDKPGTTDPWTVTDLNNMQVGVRFKGDSPTIEKRCAFIRVRIRYRAGYVHPTIHGDDPANIASMWQVVDKDNFVTPTDDATQYIALHTDAENQFLRFQMEDLEARATTANYVTTRVRLTYRHVGDKNGAGENDFPCATGTAPLSNNVERNRLEGPREQSNSGGVFITHNLPSAILGSRELVGPGNPTGGCGGSATIQDGSDVGFGTFIEYELTSTLNSSSAVISKSDVDGMESGFRMSESIIPEYRVSRIHSEVEYLRLPTGSDFMHLVVDDELDAPDDADYMQSQHSSNKLMGVDFAGIPEVSAVQSLTVYMRAKTDASAAQGWRAVLRIPGQADYEFTVETNTTYETKEYTLTTNPNTGVKFTRTEINTMQVLFKSVGETPYFPKNVSLIRAQVTYIPIPSKIDNARRINSERLLMLGKPLGLMRWTAPMAMANAELMRDNAITHRAVPRETTDLGIEQWDRALMRTHTKTYDLDGDRLTYEHNDLRDYLVTFLFTGQSAKKGRSFDGMMLITNGVTVSFVRATNAYMEDPFSGRLLELNTDEPQVQTDGIFVENSRTNLMLNAGFSLGATNVFTSWSELGLPATGASIVEDVDVLGWDENFVGAPQRSVKITGADSVTPVGLGQIVEADNGDNLSPEGSRYVIQVYHQDTSGHPLSVGVDVDPPGFSERHFRVGDQSWQSTGSTLWWELPVSTIPAIHRLPGHLPDLHTIPSSPASATRPVNVQVAVNTWPNQVNHVFGVQLEGGTFEAGTEATYPSTLIHTTTGPVVRALGELKVPNRADSPTYYFTRGTFFCVLEPNWDSADLPWFGGAKRYIYSNVLDPSNHDRLWYDQDTESFIFERKVATVTYQATKYYPAVSAGVPIRVATRWISSLGDYNETAFSTQIFVDDVRGTDGAPPSTPTMPTESDFWLGSEDGLDGTGFDGKIRRIRITQFVLTQDRIKKLR